MGLWCHQGFTTVVSSHVRKAVRAVGVVQWLGWSAAMGGSWRIPRRKSFPEKCVGHTRLARDAWWRSEEHGDVAARVHDDVLFASGEPPAFEQSQHLAARLVVVDGAAAIGDSRIVHCPLDLLLAQFSACSCHCYGLLIFELALEFLERAPK